MTAMNERVMKMVRRELEKNPSVPSRELFDKAKAMDSSLSRLSIQQFHAGYALQVKRLLKRPAPQRTTQPTAQPAKAPVRQRPTPARQATAGTTTAPARGGRDTVRSILVQFAGDIAAADQKAYVVQVIGGVDHYVNQVMRAASV